MIEVRRDSRWDVGVAFALGLLSACRATPAPPGPSAKPTSAEAPLVAVPQDLFARVNGITLQYLDWGGKGDVLLFLAGWGNTAHSFDGIAPAFSDRYHVTGLTRRGHGASEKPSGAFDLDTLVGDVIGFLDAVHAKRVVLAGHSFGGLEMPLVAGRIPDRVAGVIGKQEQVGAADVVVEVVCLAAFGRSASQAGDQLS